MKRFFKVFVLLIVCLFLLVSGVDATLDQISKSPDQSHWTLYDSKGVLVISYSGDLRYLKPYVRPGKIVQTEFIHRS
jgi:hypothetical protein